MGRALIDDRADRVDCDVDLADRFRLRLRGAPLRAADAVARQFGAARVPIAGQADLTFRYVDRVGGDEVRLIGLGEAAWDENGFYLLDGRGLGAGRMRLSFDALAPGCEIEIERSMGKPPLLVHLVNVILLARGVVALHASAALLDGHGIVAPGWSKGGKTEALLALTDRGAELIADEWAYIDAATGTMTGAPGPVRIEDWHLDQLPSLRAILGRGQRRRMWLARTTQRAHARVDGLLRKVPAGRYVGRAIRLLGEERRADVPAQALRGSEAPPAAHVEHVALLVAGSSPGITMRPIPASDVAARMVFSHLHHRSSLMAAYLQFRFAFPERRSELMETLEDRERDLLARVLPDGVPAVEVLHGPRPSITELGRMLDQFVRSAVP